jgi:hypothetical protein
VWDGVCLLDTGPPVPPVVLLFEHLRLKPQALEVSLVSGRYKIECHYSALVYNFSLTVNQKQINQRSKPSSNAGLSNANSIIRVKINANNYLPNAGNSIIRGLPNTL